MIFLLKNNNSGDRRWPDIVHYLIITNNTNIKTMLNTSNDEILNYSVQPREKGLVRKNVRQSIMTASASILLSHNIDGRVRRPMTEADMACCSGGRTSGIGRNQGVIDKRCKEARARLYTKVQQRNLQKQIQHLDTLMQKVVDSNKELYDLYAERKALLEGRL
jgi:hypothetical protein